MANSLIPKDIDLVIHGDIGFFEVLIVVSFLLHILFVNITIGSSVLAVFQEIKGIVTKRSEHDALAIQLADHTSILKSIAVVLGVAPLLIISVIYTQFFYPSTILIGKAWLSLILLLIIAFLILYAYKFLWQKMQTGTKKILHVVIGATGSLLLLFIPPYFYRQCGFHALSGNVGRLKGIFPRALLLSTNLATVLPLYSSKLRYRRNLSLFLE